MSTQLRVCRTCENAIENHCTTRGNRQIYRCCLTKNLVQPEMAGCCFYKEKKIPPPFTTKGRR